MFQPTLVNHLGAPVSLRSPCTTTLPVRGPTWSNVHQRSLLLPLLLLLRCLGEAAGPLRLSLSTFFPQTHTLFVSGRFVLLRSHSAFQCVTRSRTCTNRGRRGGQVFLRLESARAALFLFIFSPSVPTETELNHSDKKTSSMMAAA